jgi:hypothetical protein
MLTDYIQSKYVYIDLIGNIMIFVANFLGLQ